MTNPQSGRSYRVAIRGDRPGLNYCACPDFATNDLGTCKHIEFTLARIERRRGGKAALRRGYQPVFSELYLDYTNPRCVRLGVGSECPPALERLAASVFDRAQGWRLPADRFATLPDFLERVRREGHDIRCHDDALSFIAEHRDADTRARVLDEAYPKGADTPSLRKLLKVRLYRYQLEGALFAVRAGRALIGDDMGLGKTVQAIAAMELFARHFGIWRVLVVCPTSLKHQWQRELARFSRRDAQVIGGLRAAREALYAEDAFCRITNYETLARDLDLIQAWEPDLVIVDEAQRIKNWNTQAARALKRISSPYALAMTGTPLENRLEELISIVQFVDQHRLGPTWRLLHEHQQRDDHGRVIGYRALDRIGRTLAPIMLRRRKTEVLDQLPGRVDNTVFVEMTREQVIRHEENREIVARIVERWRRTGFLSEKDQIRLTCSLQNMRMSCNSTFLLDHQTDHGNKADELVALLQDLFEEPQAKVVVFSQWLRTHELIVRRLQSRGWQHVLFHGGVPADKRGALVDRFLDDPECRIFLSTDAGSVGLNLQHAAAIVVNMDLPWNPAVLEQRIGRVHRLGQSRGVQVINLVSQGTIEEGMLSVLAFKKSLFAGVLDGGQSEVILQGTRLSKFMEQVQRVTAAQGAVAQVEADDDDEPVAEGLADPDVLELPSGSPADAVPLAAAVPPATTPASPATAPAPASALAPPVSSASPAFAGQASADQAPASASPPQPSRPTAANSWAPLLAAGARLLGELAAASSSNGDSRWIETDADTGQRHLKVPVPEPETVRRLADSLTALLAELGSARSPDGQGPQRKF